MNSNSFLDLLTWRFRVPAGLLPDLTVTVLLRVTLVLAAAVVASLSLRRGPAALRHLVWASALVGALAVPGLMGVLPSWSVAILPQARSFAAPLTRDVRPAVDPHVIVAVPPAVAWVSGERPSGPDRRPPTPPEDPRAAPSPPGDRSPTLATPGKWAAWLGAIWGAGVLVVLAPLVAGHARLLGLPRRSARLADGFLVEFAGRLNRDGRRLLLLQGDATVGPMTWGLLRPVILLPAGAEAWEVDRLRAVLLHELAHVERRDCLTQACARLACAVYWFHPLVWLAAHRLRIESERACDDLVLRSGSRATDYAASLLDVARTLSSPPRLRAAAVPMARPAQLEGRLRAILDRSTNRRAVPRRVAALLVGGVAAALIPVATTRLDARTGESVATESVPPASTRLAPMIVAGRVLNPDGQPAPGAEVAVIGRRKLPSGSVRSRQQHEVMGRTRADGAGRFQLEVARTSSVTHYEVQVAATAPGFGLGWAELNRDAASPTVDVLLRVEQPIDGRLVDLQGAPTAGVPVQVGSIVVMKENQGSSEGLNFWPGVPAGLNDFWPGPVTTDRDGRFHLAGIGRGVNVSLNIEDRRFARQGLRCVTDAQPGPKVVTLPLQPALHVAGRITCADTGEPLRDAIVAVGTSSNEFGSGGSEQHRTDADGRYEANPAPQKYLSVTVYPPGGSPYLIFGRRLSDTDGAVRREVDLVVPRGVLLTGRVIERGSGRPLEGASVYYNNGKSNIVDVGEAATIPGWMAAVTSAADGKYAVAVTPGKGTLLAYGPTADFVHEMKEDRELSGGKPGGQREYAHAFRPYDFPQGSQPAASDITLQPGVTLNGRVEGPDGQPVDRAEIITTLSISPFHTFWRGDFTLPVRDGRFELHGVPPDRPVRCSFLDARNGWGTTVELSAALAAQGPLLVKLQPCGSAQARLVDEEGRPIAKGAVGLIILGSPGHGTDYDGETLTQEERGTLAADEEIYAGVDRINYWESPRTDRAGRVTLPKLIPGATYRVYDYTKGRGPQAYRWRDFTVEPGGTTDLGDIRLKAAGG